MSEKTKISKKRSDIYEKLVKSPNNIGFDFICIAAKLFGFHQRGGKGSHVIFVRKGVLEMLNFQNVKGKAKPYQIRQFLKIIEKYNLLEEL